MSDVCVCFVLCKFVSCLILWFVDDSERCRSGVNVDTTDVSWSQDSLFVDHWTPD